MKDSTFNKYCLVVDEWFINGFNGRKAYQKYYPDSSDETADVNFSNILSITKVQEYVQTKYKKAQNNAEIIHTDVLKELKDFAYLDTTEIVKVGSKEVIHYGTDSKGNQTIEKSSELGVLIKDFDDLTDIQKRSIQSVKETKDGIAVTFFPKATAFEMIAKHIGFYEKDNSQKKISERVVVNMSDYKK